MLNGFFIREKLRQKRKNFFDDSGYSDDVDFPDNIFEGGNDVGGTSQGCGSEHRL